MADKVNKVDRAFSRYFTQGLAETKSNAKQRVNTELRLSGGQKHNSKMYA